MKKLYSLLIALMLLLAMFAVTACNEVEEVADDIGEKAVLEIVLNRVPGATEDDIVELERDYDDGYMQYEGSLFYDGLEYEFEIDAETGNILDWEID